jgi:hypothetical protein
MDGYDGINLLATTPTRLGKTGHIGLRKPFAATRGSRLLVVSYTSVTVIVVSEG